jgi:Patatin-like phospholipase
MWFWVQAALAVTLAIMLVVLYWGFAGDLLKFLLDHPGETVILVFIYLIVYAQVGGALGVPYLFWNEEPVTRFFAAVGCTLLLAVIGTSAYYLIPEDEQVAVMDKIRDFLDRRSVLKLPFGHWLEPTRGNAVELSQFLRSVRFPFMVLLVLPALLPLVFSNVPRYAPVASTDLKVLLERLGRPELYDELNRHPDVSAHAPAYLIGLTVWVAGLVTGVVIVKLVIKATSFLNPVVSRLSAIVFPRIRGWLRRLGRLLGGPATRPSATRVSDEKLNAIITFFAVAILGYALLGTVFYGNIELGPVKYFGVAPAVAICALLGILTMASVGMELMRPRFRLLALFVAIVWIGWANNDPFKLAFENLPYYPPRAEPIVLTEATVLGMYDAPTQPGGLADESRLLPEWARFARAKSAYPNRKPKLAIVCVSGGATRSAYWSAVVLDRLDRRVDAAHPFHNHVRVISGASGGMVGTAYYVKWLYDNHPRSDPAKRRTWPSGDGRWYWAMPIDSLRKVARSLALRETWRMWLPRFAGVLNDRGIVLEKDWVDLRIVSFSDLRRLEEAGELPSLIFSPMTVDDGRQLLISNLDLRTSGPEAESGLQALPLNRGGALDGNDGGKTAETYSLSGIEFFKVFPAAQGFLLSTAARMSASFPWISPGVNLPTEPPLRVVDAGYYDNYGVNVASAWLHLHQAWIVKHTSGVVLVQIRDSISRNDRLGFPEPDSEGTMEKALRGFQFLFTPVDAVLAARSTSAMFRGDQAVAALGKTFTKLTNDPAFFTTAAFENSAEVTVDQAPVDGDDTWSEIVNDREPSAELSSSTTVAMSWYLTQAEVRALENAIPELEARPGFAKEREDWIVAHARQAAQAPPGSALRARLVRQLDRARKFDERARNAERVEALRRWWGEDHSVKD